MILFPGFVVLLAMAFMMPTFYFVPKAVLSSVIIKAVWSMIEFHEIISLWRGRSNHSNFMIDFLLKCLLIFVLIIVTGIELLPFMTTFLCCLLCSIEIGIVIGAQVHLLLLAYESSRTKATTIRYRVIHIISNCNCFNSAIVKLFFFRETGRQ